MSELDDVRRDLLDEQRSLDDVVSVITDDQWHTPTPSPGWDVADQIGHLAYFDAAATLAINEPAAFAASIDTLVQNALEHGFDAATLSSYRSMRATELLGSWRANRENLDQAAAGLDESTRVAWYGPSMSATSFLTARLMETWAHGTDIADALGVPLAASDRLRHIAKLGFITRKWSYSVRGEEPPPGRVRVELLGPSGSTWSWGDDDADETILGSAEDFCLVVTQRRHVDDTSLQAGPLGRHWLERAQAFAGGPTEGPPPGGRRVPG